MLNATFSMIFKHCVGTARSIHISSALALLPMPDWRKLQKSHFSSNLIKPKVFLSYDILSKQLKNVGSARTFVVWVSHTSQCLKMPKKSHFTLRAKRATFTFWVDKSSLEMPKMVNFSSFWKMRHFEEFSNNVTHNLEVPWRPLDSWHKMKYLTFHFKL